MRLRVARPEYVPGARDSLLKTLASDEEELIPDAIRGVILATPCKRMLRAVYGSAWRAIAAWAWSEVCNDFYDTVGRLRRRIYQTKLEREVEEMFGKGGEER
jgi:hypothetical protein